MAAYTPPAWAAVPTTPLALTVIRRRTPVDTVAWPAGRSALTLGRDGEVDIVAAHPSVSRFHCVFQAGWGEDDGGVGGRDDDDGSGGGGDTGGRPGVAALWDAGSANGSTVNGKRVPPRAWVRLRLGDVVGVGASTRLYVLTGEEGVGSGAAAAYGRRRKPADEGKSGSGREKGAADGDVSWGIADDDDAITAHEAAEAAAEGDGDWRGGSGGDGGMDGDTDGDGDDGDDATGGKEALGNTPAASTVRRRAAKLANLRGTSPLQRGDCRALLTGVAPVLGSREYQPAAVRRRGCSTART